MAFEAPDQIDLKELYYVLKRRAGMIAGVTVLSAALMVAASFLVPKRYKSEAQITIYGKYFQNPLVHDLVPDLYEATELKLQREALIRQALNDTFMDKIGESKGIYHSKAGTPERTRDRDELRKNIEVFPLNGTTFQVNFVSNSRELARDGGKLAVEEILKNLVDQRKRTLSNVRNAIRSRLESMAMQLSNHADPLASARPELLESELAKTEEEINGLLSRYTERHPQVVKLRTRAEWIKKWIAAQADPHLPRAVVKAQGDSSPRVLVGGELDQPTREVYQELLKKYNYLNVGIEMENVEAVNYYGIQESPDLPASAFAPKRINFLIFGAAAGLLLALFVVLLQEYMREIEPELVRATGPSPVQPKRPLQTPAKEIPASIPVVPVSEAAVSPLIAAAEALKSMTQTTINEALGNPAASNSPSIAPKNINAETIWNAPLLGTLPQLNWSKVPAPLVDDDDAADDTTGPAKDDAGGWN